MQIPLIKPTIPDWIRQADYSIVVDLVAAEGMIKDLESCPLVALDTETTGLNTRKDELVGISLCGKVGKAYYIPIRHKYGNIDRGILKSVIYPYLESNKFIFHNSKFDYQVLLKEGIEVGIENDTFFLASYLDLHRRKLKELGVDLLSLDTITLEDLIQSRKKSDGFRFDYFAPDYAYEYACQDADLTLRVYHSLVDVAAVPPKLLQLELDLIPIITYMEWNGFAVNLQKAQVHHQLTRDKLEEVRETVHRMAGFEFDIASPQQLSYVLFEKLGLKSPYETPKGKPSTNEASLQEMEGAHPIIAKILEFRKLAQLMGLFYDPYVSTISQTGESRIFSNFHPWGTATGRFSSSGPNLQQVPKTVREIFIPELGHYLVEADYSQIEYKVFASLCKDPTMVAACEAGMDMHKATAAMMFDKDPEDVTDQERNQGKTLNFSILFGAGPGKLCKAFGISMDKAVKLRDTYFEKLPSVKSWKEQTEIEAGKNGYCETVFGRRRIISEMEYFKDYYQYFQTPKLRRGLSDEDVEKVRRLGHGLRIAINAPIQGTAADIFKTALRRLYNRVLSGGQVRLLAIVHDSVILSVPMDINPRIIYEKLKECMELNIPDFVPIKVDVKFGQNWKNMVDMETFEDEFRSKV